MVAPLERGDMLAGKYRVEEILGEGAMGVVVAALHVELDRRVALKFMKLEAISQEGIERFLREARAAGRLRSEHTCQVYDVGRLENGAPYIVMELLHGEDVQTLFERSGPLPPGEVARYMIEICEAIDEAHRAGIVHRDLKPQNLFRLRKANDAAHIKVLDFGISKVSKDRDHVETAVNAVFGTPAYMSPEQLSSSKDVDARSDIWSLGVIIYQLLVGRLPFEGVDMLSLGLTICRDTPISPRTIRADLDPQLEAIILRCLTKDRDERYASAAALSRALAPFADPVVMWMGRTNRMWQGDTALAVDAGTNQVAATVPPTMAPGSDPAIAPVIRPAINPAINSEIKPIASTGNTLAPAPSRSKVPLFVGGGLAVVTSVVVAFVAVGGRGSGGSAEVAAARPAASDGSVAPVEPPAPTKRKPKLAVVQLTEKDLEDQAASKKGKPGPKPGARAGSPSDAIDPVATTTEKPMTQEARDLTTTLSLFGASPIGAWMLSGCGDDFLVANLGPQATLRIESKPSGADVNYDGASVGKTPLSITVDRGAYDVDLELSSPGYADRPLRMWAAVDATSHIELAQLIKLRILSKPPGAAVETMGDPIGTTPLEVQVAPSEAPQSFTLQLPGYLAKTVDIVPEKNGTTTVVLDREPQMIAHEIDSVPPGVDVVVANQIVGKTPYRVEFLEDKGKFRDYLLRAPPKSSRYRDTPVHVAADKPLKRTVRLRDICANHAAEAQSTTPSLVNPYDPCRGK